jgi:6-phosphogluconolactonase (cycloisomerase 2 family)
MKASLKCISAALLAFFGFALLTASVYADEEEGHTFVYTNNDAVPNTVTAFRVLPGGALSLIGTSMTGGSGTGGFFATQPRIAATITRNFLYVGNGGSSNISAFKIDSTTGSLGTPLGPFPTGGGVGSGGAGIALAVTLNGKFLYAANFNSSNISAFRIASNGTLIPIASSPFAAAGSPISIKVTPDGKFVAVGLPFVGTGGSVQMFRISSTPTPGALTPVGSFAQGGPGTVAADLDINCKSNLLFAGHANGTGTVVSVAKIASNGVLSAITNSPFTFASGSDSETAVVLSPDNRHLFVNNLFSNTITSLDVAPGGGLTLETDSPSGSSPFTNLGGTFPSGIGMNRKGDLLYVANPNNFVTGFHVDSDGGLAPLTPMNAFSTGSTGNLLSLTVFPAHKDEGNGDEVDDRGRKGHFDFEADHECADSGEMDFRDDSGNEMKGNVSAANATGNTAIISGSGTLADSTPVQYTAIVTGNAPVVGLNQFAISWITATGTVFQTSGALTNGYIAVH